MAEQFIQTHVTVLEPMIYAIRFNTNRQKMSDIMTSFFDKLYSDRSVPVECIQEIANRLQLSWSIPATKENGD
jgi:hypothetical protein